MHIQVDKKQYDFVKKKKHVSQSQRGSSNSSNGKKKELCDMSSDYVEKHICNG